MLARPAPASAPADLRLDGESNGVAWVALRRFGEVPLHPGLAASLPRLEALLREVGADL